VGQKAQRSRKWYLEEQILQEKGRGTTRDSKHEDTPGGARKTTGREVSRRPREARTEQLPTGARQKSLERAGKREVGGAKMRWDRRIKPAAGIRSRISVQKRVKPEIHPPNRNFNCQKRERSKRMDSKTEKGQGFF